MRYSLNVYTDGCAKGGKQEARGSAASRQAPSPSAALGKNYTPLVNFTFLQGLEQLKIEQGTLANPKATV